MNLSLPPSIAAPLDPEFLPAVLFNHHYVATLETGQGVVLGLEREKGLVSRCETRVRSSRMPKRCGADSEVSLLI